MKVILRMEDSVDASIRRFQHYIKKQRKTYYNELKQHKQYNDQIGKRNRKKNSSMVILSDRQTKYYPRRLGRG